MYIELHASSAFSFLDGASLPEALDRARRGARLSGAGAARSRRRLRRSALSSRREACRAQGDRRRRADGGHRRSRVRGHGRIAVRTSRDRRVRGPSSRDPRSFTLPVLDRIARGLSEPVPARDAMKLRRRKAKGALDARRSRRRTSAGWSRWPAAPRSTARASASAAWSIGSSASFGASNVYVELQRHLLRDEEADNQTLRDLAVGVSPAGRSPPTACASPSRPIGRSTTCSPASATRRRSSAPGRRLSCNAERYLKSPEAMARLFADMPEALAAHRASSPIASTTRWRISATAFPNTRCRRARRWRRSCARSTQAGARERYRPYRRSRARARSSASWI